MLYKKKPGKKATVRRLASPPVKTAEEKAAMDVCRIVYGSANCACEKAPATCEVMRRAARAAHGRLKEPGGLNPAPLLLALDVIRGDRQCDLTMAPVGDCYARAAKHPCARCRADWALKESGHEG